MTPPQAKVEEPAPPHIITLGEVSSWVGDSAIKFPLYHGTGSVVLSILKDGFSRERTYWGPYGPGVFFAQNVFVAAGWGSAVLKCWVRVRNLFSLNVSDPSSMDRYRDVIGARNGEWFFQWNRSMMTTDIRDKGYDALELRADPRRLSAEEREGGTMEILGSRLQYVVFDVRNVRIERVVTAVDWVKQQLPADAPDWLYACVKIPRKEV